MAGRLDRRLAGCYHGKMRAKDRHAGLVDMSRMIQDKANDTTRWGLYDVPAHYRWRLAALARQMGVGQTEALGACLQAAEAAMGEPVARGYAADLRRRACTPPGASRRAPVVLETLPELPELDPPLGIGLLRRELLVYEPKNGPSQNGTEHIIRRRMEELAAAGLLTDEDRELFGLNPSDDDPNAA